MQRSAMLMRTRWPGAKPAFFSHSPLIRSTGIFAHFESAAFAPVGADLVSDHNLAF